MVSDNDERDGIEAGGDMLNGAGGGDGDEMRLRGHGRWVRGYRGGIGVGVEGVEGRRGWMCKNDGKLRNN